MSKSTANKDRLGYVGKKPGGSERKSDDWYTPDFLLGLVRRVLGDIELDPFSSKVANARVGAYAYIDEKMDAFSTDWAIFGEDLHVFMNPPYSSGLCPRACEEFIKYFKRGVIAEGIVLTNNATETRWAQSLFQSASAVCFPFRRISFWNADDKVVSGNTRGQIVYYFGDGTSRFCKVFASLGAVYSPH